MLLSRLSLPGRPTTTLDIVMNNSEKVPYQRRRVDPVVPNPIGVIAPVIEAVWATISGGTGTDVDRTVAAARNAFPAWAAMPVNPRIALLERVLDI